MDLTFDDTFDLKNYGGKHKLFDGGSMKLGYTITVPADVKTPEGEEIQKIAKADWAKQMKAFKDAKEKEYKAVIAATEANVVKTAEKKREEFSKLGGDKALKALKEWLDREIDGVNIMIKNALKAFEGVVKKAMDDLWTKVATAIDKKFKTKLKNEKIKAVFKIIGWSGIIVLAAAASIVAGVIGLLTAPTGVGTVAAVGVILASVATGVTAVKKIYDTYASTWPDHKKSAKRLIEKTQALKEALEYEEKKFKTRTSQGVALGPKEKLKLFLGNAAGKRKELEAAVKDIATWTASMLQDVEKDAKASEAFAKKIEEVEAKLKTEKDDKKAAELRKLVDEYVKHLFDKRVKMENARLYLKRYAALVVEGQAMIKEESRLTPNALEGFLGKLQAIAGSDEVGHLITAGKSGAELFKAIMKAVAK